MRAALPTFGTGYELIVLAAAIIGGTALSGGSGSIFGAVLGALVISLIVNGIAHLGISTYWSAYSYRNNNNNSGCHRLHFKKKEATIDKIVQYNVNLVVEHSPG